MSDIQLVESYFTNVAAQNVNKAFVYISDCNLPLKQGPIQAILASCAGGQVINQFMFIALDNYIVMNQLSQINMSHNHFSTSPSE